MSDLEQMIRAIALDVFKTERRKESGTVEMLTVEAYAKAWSISQSTVRAAVRDGRLTHERVERGIRIPAAARIEPRVRRDADDLWRARLARVGRR